MKILLINPLENVEEGFFKFSKSIRRARVLPPLGLAYIAAILREKGIEDVSILDANALQMNSTQIKKYIEGNSPDLTGVTATTPTLRPALLVCKIIKQINPKIITVVGGPHVTVLPEETASLDDIDVCVVGEGEFVMLNLINTIKDDRDWSNIPGIVYELNNKTHFNPPENRIKNLDNIPFPARDLLPNNRYYDATSKHFHAMSMITSRGCPYNCLFCEKEVRGGHYRCASPERVVDEMEEVIKKYGFKEIIIYDDTFTVNKKRVVEICKDIIRRNLGFSWDCRTRVDCVTPSLLKLMKKAGCYRISYGVESRNERILKILRKGITPEQSREAIKWTKDAGMMVLAYFMIGTPSETKKEIIDTLKFSKELEPDFGYYSITVPYPGTDLYNVAIKERYMPSHYWEKFISEGGILPDKIPYFESKEISRKYLDRTIKKAYREFYFTPKYIWGRLKYIRSMGDLRWHMKIARSLLM